MNFNKTLGYILLFLGLIIIGWGIYTSYNIFTDKRNPPQIFKIPEEEITLSPGQTKDRQDQIESQMKSLIQEQLGDMIPTGGLSQILNLASWSIFMGILIFGAGKISSIGVQLIKK